MSYHCECDWIKIYSQMGCPETEEVVEFYKEDGTLACRSRRKKVGLQDAGYDFSYSHPVYDYRYQDGEGQEITGETFLNLSSPNWERFVNATEFEAEFEDGCKATIRAYGNRFGGLGVAKMDEPVKREYMSVLPLDMNKYSAYALASC